VVLCGFARRFPGVRTMAVLRFIPGDGAAQPLVRALLDAVPSGSHLAASHGTLDFSPPEYREMHERMRASGRSDAWTRGRDEFGALFDGLELEAPGTGRQTNPGVRPIGMAARNYRPHLIATLSLP